VLRKGKVDVMKEFFGRVLMVIGLAAVFSLGSVWAQEGNAATQAVISLMNLLDPDLVAELEAEFGDDLDSLALALVDRLVEQGVLADDIAESMRQAVTAGVLPRDAFVLFAADLFNGAAPLETRNPAEAERLILDLSPNFVIPPAGPHAEGAGRPGPGARQRSRQLPRPHHSAQQRLAPFVEAMSIGLPLLPRVMIIVVAIAGGAFLMWHAYTPYMSHVHLQRAQEHYAWARLERAEAELLRALQQTPGNPVLHAELGRVRLGMTRWRDDTTGDRAVAAYRQAAALNPLDGERWLDLGLALTRLEQFDDADEALRRALARDPSNAAFHLAVGRLREQQGLLHEARANYEQALAIRFDGRIRNMIAAIDAQLQEQQEEQ
jgi:tetratricopeptide (TPR) repeat protein